MNVIAIDIGGTAIKCTQFTNGKIGDIAEIPSQAKSGVDTLLLNIYKACELFGRGDVISVSSTGQVDSASGFIVYANDNAPGYRNTKLKEILTKRYHCPVFVENDVNAAATGEAVYGAGQGVSDFLCLTYGTGVGGAVFIDHKVYTGSKGIAGEVGHILTHPGGLPCACGMRGCYEQYASATALIRMAKQLNPEYSDGRIIFERLHAGDTDILSVIDNWVDEIVYGLISLVHTLNPSCIILGGGVMQQRYITDRIDEKLRNMVMDTFADFEIRPAMLGNSAGLYGMLAIAQRAGYR